jgi:hypothetical protein
MTYEDRRELLNRKRRDYFAGRRTDDLDGFEQWLLTDDGRRWYEGWRAMPMHPGWAR